MELWLSNYVIMCMQTVDEATVDKVFWPVGPSPHCQWSWKTAGIPEHQRTPTENPRESRDFL